MKTIHSFLELSAVRYANNTALIHDDRNITYAELNQQAGILAVGLMHVGLKPGERVALIWENSIDWVICYYAVLKAGATVVPVNTDIKPNSFQLLMQNLAPHLVLASRRFARLIIGSGIYLFHKIVLQNAASTLAVEQSSVLDFELLFTFGLITSSLPVVSEFELANIIYTSGSTGEPKGVMLTHGNIHHNVKAVCEYQKLTHRDQHLSVLPFYYVMGLSVLNTHIAVGGTVVINNHFAYPARFVDQLINANITGFSGVPSSFALLLHRSPLAQRNRELRSLRFVAQAGGHMSNAVKTQLREILPQHVQIFIMYGATEAAARISYLPPEFYKSKMGSIGKAIPGVSLRVLNEFSAECEPGEIGELVAHGPNIMQGYFRDEDASKKVLTSFGYHTGDLAYKDAEGFYYLVGRRDSLIKVGGHRISPQEIEDLILDTGLAMEVVVIGISDSLLGHRLVALIAGLKSGVDMTSFEQICKKQLPKTKRPGDFLYVEQIPKKSNGKPDRQAVHLLYEQLAEKV